MSRRESLEIQMNPSFAQPSQPSLVSALMDDRINEATEMRLAAAAPAAELDKPYRFRRFLAAAPKRPRTRPIAAAPQSN